MTATEFRSKEVNDLTTYLSELKRMIDTDPEIADALCRQEGGTGVLRDIVEKGSKGCPIGVMVRQQLSDNKQHEGFKYLTILYPQGAMMSNVFADKLEDLTGKAFVVVRDGAKRKDKDVEALMGIDQGYWKGVRDVHLKAFEVWHRIDENMARNAWRNHQALNTLLRMCRDLVKEVNTLRADMFHGNVEKKVVAEMKRREWIVSDEASVLRWARPETKNWQAQVAYTMIKINEHQSPSCSVKAWANAFGIKEVSLKSSMAAQRNAKRRQTWQDGIDNLVAAFL